MTETCGVELSKDTFKQMNSEDRDAIIFDCLRTLTKEVQEIKTEKKVNAKKLMGLASFFGVIGGIIGSMLKPWMP